MTGMNLKDREYLGDGVYICHDGYSVWLTTERETGTHFIALEPEMIKNLNDYVNRIKKKYRV